MAKGEQVVIDFFVYMNDVYTKSFSLKAKYQVISLMQSFIT